MNRARVRDYPMQISVKTPVSWCTALPVFVLLGFSLAGNVSADPLLLKEIPNPSSPGSAEPHLATAPDGRVVLSWLEPHGNGDGQGDGHSDGVALRHSTLEGGAFGAALTVASGEDFFVNWADFPSVVPIDDQLWAAHWLVKQPGGTYAYDIAIAVSKDAGKTWTPPLTPHTDGTATEHGFVDLFPWKDGVGAVWLDGRNMEEDSAHHEDDSGIDAEQAPGPPSGMTLRSAHISDDGALLSGDLIDPLVCDCCQTDVAIGSRGPVLVYRNRTPEEIRDIYAALTLDGAWQPGSPVGDDRWEINGCPVNGPALAASGEHVVTAWFTMAGDVPKLRAARSNDGGQTFGAAIELDSGAPVGRTDVVLLEGGDAVVSWLRDARPGQGQLVIRRVSLDGELGPAQVVATAGSGRPAGFPQMVSDGRRLVFAWTESLDGNSSLVRTAEVTLGSE